MEDFELELQEPVEPLDEATKAAIENGLASARRGDLVTLEQSTINLRKRLEAWRRAKEEVKLAA